MTKASITIAIAKVRFVVDFIVGLIGLVTKAKAVEVKPECKVVVW